MAIAISWPTIDGFSFRKKFLNEEDLFYPNNTKTSCNLNEIIVNKGSMAELLNWLWKLRMDWLIRRFTRHFERWFARHIVQFSWLCYRFKTFHVGETQGELSLQRDGWTVFRANSHELGLGIPRISGHNECCSKALTFALWHLTS